MSKAYLEGFYYKPRMDKEILNEHHEGLIALSGCLSGEIPYLIGQKNLDGAMAVAGEFQEIFGKEHFYLEVQANGLEHQRVANSGLLEIAKTDKERMHRLEVYCARDVQGERWLDRCLPPDRGGHHCLGFGNFANPDR